jgi:hypothetical protein
MTRRSCCPPSASPPTNHPSLPAFSSFSLFSSPFSLHHIKNNSVSTEGYLYGDGYSIHGCKTVSSTCQKFFIEESCFYECDKNMGKWRKHNVSNPIDNGWQIEKMPVSAKYMDRWWEACKEEQICAGPTKSYFEMPDCLALNKKNNNTAGCKRFGDVYKSGKEVAEVMWWGCTR